ncbi:ribonuclease P protein component [Desulforamulus reducens MI-1]|uniref:Ribonuclease P protein component n=1 Tax=Desulforamulus reducens (strain ATCC BAA-1160 / DSM 100696 / MI-1) TaxID=349161 RepID=RNPA_DESRM|nr:ribonuclease P protein component [Desulforamulus reducens]A4J9S4.1 RecName: Full=Ribonuclease P protein component; Short=RNase P protein; Short=RNaseP protein; AltName: Full=Protein C5 [Desulforamulus reducens MI-1]ABO51827.1 ribonuclease P protein component [Desulforamulus reducens MI-1]
MKKFVSLKKNSDFRNVYRFGVSAANRYLVLYKFPNKGLGRRFGFSISKKVGKAVCRNRLRRILKELCRFHLDRFSDDCDFVFIVRQTSSDQDFHQMEKHMWHVWGKLNKQEKN